MAKSKGPSLIYKKPPTEEDTVLTVAKSSGFAWAHTLSSKAGSTHVLSNAKKRTSLRYTPAANHQWFHVDSQGTIGQGNGSAALRAHLAVADKVRAQLAPAKTTPVKAPAANG